MYFTVSHAFMLPTIPLVHSLFDVLLSDYLDGHYVEIRVLHLTDDGRDADGS